MCALGAPTHEGPTHYTGANQQRTSHKPYQPTPASGATSGRKRRSSGVLGVLGVLGILRPVALAPAVALCAAATDANTNTPTRHNEISNNNLRIYTLLLWAVVHSTHSLPNPLNRSQQGLTIF